MRRNLSVAACLVFTQTFSGLAAEPRPVLDLRSVSARDVTPELREHIGRRFDLGKPTIQAALTSLVRSKLGHYEHRGLRNVLECNGVQGTLWAMDVLRRHASDLSVYQNLISPITDSGYADSYCILIPFLEDTTEIPFTEEHRRIATRPEKPRRVCDSAFGSLRFNLEMVGLLPPQFSRRIISTKTPMEERDVLIGLMKEWWHEEGGREKVLANTRLLAEDLLSNEDQPEKGQGEGEGPEARAATAEEFVEPSPPSRAEGAGRFAWVPLAIGLVAGTAVGAAAATLILRRQRRSP